MGPNLQKFQKTKTKKEEEEEKKNHITEINPFFREKNP